MDCSTHEYYSYNHFFLSCVGLWPYDKKIKRVFSCSVIVGFSTVALLTQIIEVIENGFQIDDILNSLPLMNVNFSVTVSSFIYYYSHDKLKHLLEFMTYDWRCERNNHEDQIKRRYAEFGKKFTLFLFCGSSTLYGAFGFLSLFYNEIIDFIIPINGTRPKTLPFPGEYFVDVEIYYYYIILFMDILVLIEMFYIDGVVVNFWMYLLHLYAMGEETIYRFQNLIPEIEERNEEDNQIVDQICHKSLTICIERHIRIIKFCDGLQSLYAPIMVLLTFGVVAIASPALVQLSNFKNVGYVTILEAVFVIFFMLMAAIMGQKIIDYSSDIEYNAYMGNWYMRSAGIQKMLQPIISQARKPCSLNVKIFTLSLIGFRSMMNTIFSYVTVLNQVR